MDNALKTFLNTGPLASNQRLEITADWLMKLRWVALAGQLITLMFVIEVLNISFEPAPLWIALALTATSNLVFTIWLKRRPAVSPTRVRPDAWHQIFLVLMLLDLLALSSLLFHSGGHTNPFSLFYFVNLALAGMNPRLS